MNVTRPLLKSDKRNILFSKQRKEGSVLHTEQWRRGGEGGTVRKREEGTWRWALEGRLRWRPWKCSQTCGRRKTEVPKTQGRAPRRAMCPERGTDPRSTCGQSEYRHMLQTPADAGALGPCGGRQQRPVPAALWHLPPSLPTSPRPSPSALTLAGHWPRW